MITVILYGRNDQYGYNLARRAAISLNCIAEVLISPEDEILFVDYNTPETLPSFIESIADTLTDQAKQLIKIIRVPPSIHASYAGETTLQTNEPLARNIGIRRSNPNNRWILSTNTDMIFYVAPPYNSLSDLVSTLSDGYYATPRYELPDGLWDNLNRSEPQQNINLCYEWGNRFHLHYYVRRDPSMRYDAPGDFQLFTREQAFDLCGFDERMTRGWHVDSNFCKRLFLVNQATHSLKKRVFAYHCLHYREVTPMHRHRSPSNDLFAFFDKIEDPKCLHQKETWGLPNEAFPTKTLLSKNFYYSTLSTFCQGENNFSDRSINPTIYYEPNRLIPYLTSIFATFHPSTAISYYGENLNFYISYLKTYFRNLNINYGAPESKIVIFDFGFLDFSENKGSLIKLLQTFASEALKIANLSTTSQPVLFVCLNSTETVFESFIRLFLSTTTLPTSCNILTGYVLNHALLMDNQSMAKKCLLGIFQALDISERYLSDFCDDFSFRFKYNNQSKFLSSNKPSTSNKPAIKIENWSAIPAGLQLPELKNVVDNKVVKFRSVTSKSGASTTICPLSETLDEFNTCSFEAPAGIAENWSYCPKKNTMKSVCHKSTLRFKLLDPPSRPIRCKIKIKTGLHKIRYPSQNITITVNGTLFNRLLFQIPETWPHRRLSRFKTLSLVIPTDLIGSDLVLTVEFSMKNKSELYRNKLSITSIKLRC